MKILVCIKQVVDTTMAVELASSGHSLAEDKLCYIVNPADECAVEEALRIKDSQPKTEIILLSIGPPRAELALRHCLAMGAERAIRIWDDSLVNVDTQVRAWILAKAIAGLKVDLILCGSRSLDLAEGQVPGMLAEFLSLPQVTAVTKLELSVDAKGARLQRKLHGGNREIVECSLPALFALEPGSNTPRYPMVRRVMWSRNCPIDKLELNNIGCSGDAIGTASRTKLLSLKPPRPEPKRTPIIDMLTMDMSLSADDRLSLVLSGGMTEKDGKLWQETPQKLADRFVELMKQEGFL